MEKAYAAMVYGEGVVNPDAADCVKQSYQNDVSDEFVLPVVCNPEGRVRPGDSVIFFNFRPDRAREIVHALVNPAFNGFERRVAALNLTFVCMTEYEAEMPGVAVAYRPKELNHIMGQVVSRHNLTQLRIAETTKYAHVTFFFNGGEEKVFPGEDRKLINTPDVATFDLKPEMSAYQVCDAVVERISKGIYDLIVLNFANCDMVGHTGDFKAAVKAVETVDACVGRVAQAVLDMGGICLITADHGNAEKMLDDDGVTPFTAHTVSPVPFLVVGRDLSLRSGGKLGDIAPTMLALLGIEQPADMTGESLIL